MAIFCFCDILVLWMYPKEIAMHPMTFLYYFFYYLLIYGTPVLIIYLILRPRVPIVINHWSLYFTDRQFSSIEFYESVERILNERQAPDLAYSRVEFIEKGIFSNKRIYCRIRFNHYVFDICAAPYGTGYFTSWWFGESIPLLTRILYRIPLLGWYLEKKHQHKTYFILDNESVFQAAVHQAVIDTIKLLSADKGVRALSDTEQQNPRMRV